MSVRFLLSNPRPQKSPLFPYTTLFRSTKSTPAHAACASMAESRTPSSAKNNATDGVRSEEHTSQLQSRGQLVCRLLPEKKKFTTSIMTPPAVHTDPDD